MNVDTPPPILSHDQFLYACRQALTARTTKTGFDSHLRHEPFLYGRFYAGQTLTVSGWRQHLKAIFAHAYKASPQFRRSEAINLDTISFFSLAIATLVADLDALMKHFAGMPLPPVLGVPREKKESDRLPALAKLFETFEAHLAAQQRASVEEHEMPEYDPFPLDKSGKATSDAAAQDRVQVSEEFWGTIFALVRQTFPKHDRQIMSFLLWNFQPEVAPAAVDWRIRPPVGDAFQQFLRSFQSGGRAGAQFASGPGGRGPRAHDRGGRGDGHGAGRNTASGGPGQRHSRVDKRPGPDQQEGETRRDREAVGAEAGLRNTARADRFAAHDAGPQARPQAAAGRRPAQEVPGQGADGGSSPAVLEEARREVEHSIRILEKNSKRPGIRLAPQNSFVRREQHMVAAEKGFQTESVGEGRDRAVYIKNRGAN